MSGFDRIPRLPEKAYTGIVGDFVEIMAPLSEAPREFLYGAFMCAVGAAFPQVVVDWEEDGLELTTFVVLLGPTGTKKGTAKRRATNTVMKAAPELRRPRGGGNSPEGMLRVIHEQSFPNGPDGLSVKPGVLFDVGEWTGVMKHAERAGNPLI